jgi:hypothetical protein
MGHFFLAKNQKKFPEYRELFFWKISKTFSNKILKLFSRKKIGNFFSRKNSGIALYEIETFHEFVSYLLSNFNHFLGVSLLAIE